jgi:ferric-dicitrate binding protein FerR (iron transport regulator)
MSKIPTHNAPDINLGSSDNHRDKRFYARFHVEEEEFGLKSELLTDLNNISDEKSPEVNFDKLYGQILKKIRGERSGKVAILRHLPWISAAAIVAAGLIISGIINSQNRQDKDLFMTSITPAGSISQMVLPDSTVIFMNAASAIKYNPALYRDKREVFLEGEAWFKVSKKQGAGFVVHTPAYDVKVTGTEFNVKAYAEDREVVTTLEEGSVEIASGKSLKLKEPAYLKPGDQLTYSMDKNTITKKNVEATIYSAWKDNKLIFINKSLGELFVILERRYGVKFEVKDTDLLKYHYDGTLKNEKITEILEILNHTLPINYRIENQIIIIEKKQKN